MGLGSFSGHRAGFWPKNLFLLWDPGFRRWPVCSPRRYLRFGTFRSIFSGRSAARRVIFRPPGRIFARKSVFCYRTPDFVNGPFLALDDIFDLAPSDRFLNFSFPSYGPKWPKMAIFRSGRIAYISTPNFGPNSMKLGQIVRFTKKMTLNKCGPGSGPNYGETVVCPLGREGNKWPKIRFFAI